MCNLSQTLHSVITFLLLYLLSCVCVCHQTNYSGKNVVLLGSGTF